MVNWFSSLLVYWLIGLFVFDGLEWFG